MLLGHSAGPSVILAFLRGQPAAWKARHVARFVSLNGNIAGEIDCLENLWHGGDFLSAAENVTEWDRAAYRATQWTWGITAWCMPQVATYGEKTLVEFEQDGTAPARAYTGSQLAEIFAAFGAGDTVGAVWRRVRDLTLASAGPSVPTTCLYGTGLPTPIGYRFPRRVAQPTAIFGSGDGQQDDVTNSACLQWPDAVGRGVWQAE